MISHSPIGTNGEPGTGNGLEIAKRFCREADINVKIYSTENKGTIVTLEKET